MSEEKPVAAAKEKKTKKKNSHSFMWVVGIVILILISLTFVLPTTMFSSTQSAISFGKYNGKSIDLTADSFFYYQLNSIYSYYAQYYGESVANNYSYNIYYSAFQQALINENFQALADKAGFKATNEQIYQAVIDSNYYSDGTNGFSEELYNSASDMQKEQIVAWMKEYVPFQEVQNTIMSTPISSAESDFIKSLSDERRSVEYIALTGVMYPDEDAVEYAKERADLFETLPLTLSVYSTEDDAKAALDSLTNGTKTKDDVIAESIGSSLETRESYYRYLLSSYLKSSESVNELFSAEEGATVGPVETTDGYALFFVEGGKKAADFASSSVIDDIKEYITANDSALVKAYLDSVIDSIYSEASVSFEDTAEKYGLNVNSVNDVALNTGDSQFVYSFNYTAENGQYTGSSTNGYIYTEAANDTSWAEKVFSVDYNTVLEPFYVNDAYIIARVKESSATDSYTPTLLANMYSSYAPQYGLMDYETKVLQSDAVEDNFISGYFQAAFGTSVN